MGPTEGAQRTREQVAQHLLLNFTDMADYVQRGSRVIVRGEGCQVFDDRGHAYIDGLSGLFCSNLGHSYGARIGAAAAAQLAELTFSPTWYLAHPTVARLAQRLVERSPGMSRVYFTSSGSEAVESAWKLVRQWHAAHGQPQRTKAISRKIAYHGTTLGALSFTGLTDCRAPFEPMAVPTTFLSNTNAYRHPQGHDPQSFTQALLDEAQEAICFADPEHVAMFIAEPVQNAGGALVPPPGYWAGLRALCDKYGIVLVADETITAFGRLGEWFGSSLQQVQPDLITFAKGVTAGHAPLGGVLMNERMAEPFIHGGQTFMHGSTYSGHPLSTAIADTVLDAYEQDGVFENVRRLAPRLASGLAELRRIGLVGDVRGQGFFWALELVKDAGTKEPFTQAEADWLLREELSGHMDDLGLLCRLDDRGEPVIQLAPPLVADERTLDRIVDIVGTAVERAWQAWSGSSTAPKAALVAGAA